MYCHVATKLSEQGKALVNKAGGGLAGGSMVFAAWRSHYFHDCRGILSGLLYTAPVINMKYD